MDRPFGLLAELHPARRGQAAEELLDLAGGHLAVAGLQGGHDLVQRALPVAQAEHGRAGVVEDDDRLRGQQHVPLPGLVEAEPGVRGQPGPGARLSHGRRRRRWRP